jgi:MATE family multidrug resistance protein
MNAASLKTNSSAGSGHWMTAPCRRTIVRSINVLPTKTNAQGELSLGFAIRMQRCETPSSAREGAAGSPRELLRVALPLVISAGSLSLMYFTDRMLLTWYSLDAMAASLPAGMLHYTLYSLFFGTATYINTFVAQYEGAGRSDRVGSALWQGIYFSLLASVGMLLLGPLAGQIFAALDHSESIRALEAEYFGIMCYGTLPVLLQSTLACFYSGRGRTWTIMWVNLVAMLVNITLDYLLIFGIGPFPEMGIAGAAIATVTANVVAMLMYVAAIWGWGDLQRYALWSGRRYDPVLFARLLRFGLPNGVHMLMDVICYTLFIHLVSLMGKEQLAASNLAFNINALAFVPMLGFGTAISTLVGKRIGEGRPELAVRTTWMAFRWTSGYMLLFCAGFVLVPDLILLPYSVGLKNPAEFAAVHDHVVTLLRFVAVYSWFDAMTIVFGSAIRGAGDTRFSLLLTTAAGWALMVIPTYLAFTYTSQPMLWAWTAGTAYMVVLGIGFLMRFRDGAWQSMRVIEPSLEDEYELPLVDAVPELAIENRVIA